MPSYSIILTYNFSDKQWTCNGQDYSGITWLDSSPMPTQEELDALWIPTQETIAKQNCKKQASALLYETDWTTIPDVADPTNSPYLANQADFIAYRNTVRQLAVYPVVDPVFPTEPQPIWS